MKTRQYLKDYRPSVWQVPTIQLRFDIRSDHVLVHARSDMRGQANHALRLDGRDMSLQQICIDGRVLSSDEYTLDDSGLSLSAPADQFVLETTVRLDPWSNTSLEGLYYAGEILCTQCESHGFSRITYALDRPDVMSIYQVEIEADRQRWPYLLSNGEMTEQQTLSDGRQRVCWQDPHPKPCYLFALVAGDMAMRSRKYTTSEGRDVTLAFYCDHGIEDRLEHAIDSLERSMRWDERVYGLAYDLDTYNVVVAGAFNMGAMENKGLNIFNPKYVLASPDSATDADYAGVEAVIGHEYFHNWTGNRVTCRDWFQLSLKEGLTVFRDQQFSADCGAGPAQRIEQVRFLRARQFAEDAGPLAHPVRPESYLEMNNFYTVTVYEKGAELVRLLHAREGEAGFRKGMDLYFQRHDGQAVTIEDFQAAHGDANGLDTQGLLRWYAQAGTPQVVIRDDYRDGRYTLHCRQSVPGHPEAQPVLIPIAISLLDQQGQAMIESQVLELDQAEQTFSFDVAEEPLPVLFEGLSAPVNWDYPYSENQLSRLARDAQDPFSRWEASQRLYLAWLRARYAGESASLPEIFAEILNGPGDPAVIAELLSPPQADELLMQWPEVDPVKLSNAVNVLKHELAAQLQTHIPVRLDALGQQLNQPYHFEPVAAARRRLRAQLLTLWIRVEPTRAAEHCQQLFDQADNLTDRMAALQALVHSDSPQRDTLMQAFFERYQNDKLVLDRWFALQAMGEGEAGLAAVRVLLQHSHFDPANPNRVRALLGSLGSNPSALYSEGGLELLAEQVLVFDGLNPQLASRLITPLAACHTLAAPYRTVAEQALQGIVSQARSADVLEQAKRILGQSD